MKPLCLLFGLASISTTTLALTIPSTQQLLNVFYNGDSNTPLKPSARETCPQAPKVSIPEDDRLHSSLHFLTDPSFRAQQAKRLSRAVQVPTTVSDYMTDPWDPAFEPVVEFQGLLKEMFPLV